MDPLTHALLGAATAHALVGSRQNCRIWLIGAVGGLLPDADIFISSASDPLLAIEYHRHFTHSFAFIPLGGLIAASPWLIQRRQRLNSWAILAAATIGYATHGLLDACTNYGTHLLWPFSTDRTAWHWITTIGPLLTLMLLLGLIFATRRRSRFPAIAALVLSLAYIGNAAVQREHALDVQQPIAASREHTITRADMFPTVGNPFIWRSVYQSENMLYTDRIRVMGSSTPMWKEGSTVALLREQDLPPDVYQDARVRRDFARFNYFSDGWVARATGDSSIIGDARYSLRTDTFEPIWGVRFHPGTSVPTEWVDHTAQNRIPLSLLWDEINGNSLGYRSMPPLISVPKP